MHNNGTVLIADDNPQMRRLLADLLMEEGYAVTAVSDGVEALEALRREAIDLVLLDVLMPGCTGFAVCREIKQNPETCLIPVVLVTGLNDRANRIQGIRSGADDFLCKPVHSEELLARVRSLLKLRSYTSELEHAEKVLFSLALSIEAKDPYTEGHCERLSRYAVLLGQHLGLPEDLLQALRRGGIVHDIGKVAIPESILQKPGALTAEERRMMQQHTVIGERICGPLKSFQEVLPIILHHHEKIDGSGYPDGLHGAEIPLTARILTTVDIYDALTTVRPYRQALSQEKAFGVMREEVQRGWWDGEIVEEFFTLASHLVWENHSCATPLEQRR